MISHAQPHTPSRIQDNLSLQHRQDNGPQWRRRPDSRLPPIPSSTNTGHTAWAQGIPGALLLLATGTGSSQASTSRGIARQRHCPGND